MTSTNRPSVAWARESSSKYQALSRYLSTRKEDVLHMSFDDVAAIIGEIPVGARTYREFWANSFGHAHARHGWIWAGWKTANVNMATQELDFVHEIPRPGGDGPVTKAMRSRSSDPEVTGQEELLRSRIETSAGGLQNLWVVILAIEQYLAGDLLETELGRLIRKRWPRRK